MKASTVDIFEAEHLNTKITFFIKQALPLSFLHRNPSGGGLYTYSTRSF